MTKDKNAAETPLQNTIITTSRIVMRSIHANQLWLKRRENQQSNTDQTSVRPAVHGGSGISFSIVAHTISPQIAIAIRFANPMQDHQSLWPVFTNFVKTKLSSHHIEHENRLIIIVKQRQNYGSTHKKTTYNRTHAYYCCKSSSHKLLSTSETSVDLNLSDLNDCWMNIVITCLIWISTSSKTSGFVFIDREMLLMLRAYFRRCLHTNQVVQDSSRFLSVFENCRCDQGSSCQEAGTY